MGQTFDVVFVGHMSLDNILLPHQNAPFNVIGGAVTYSSLTVNLLGSSAAVVSKVGTDFPEGQLEWLNQKGINTGYIKRAGPNSTGFELKYNQNLDNRTLKLTNQAVAITVEDIPTDLQAKAIHVGPIINEVSLDLLEELKRHCKTLAIDPQGLMRRFDQNGQATNNVTMDKRLLSYISIYKSSLEEIYNLTGKTELKAAVDVVHDFGVEIVIATMGSKGAVLSSEGTIKRLGVCRSKKIVDPTGAGDVFLGAFLNEYINEKKIFWCACVGAAASSIIIEEVGPVFNAGKQEVYQRASSLYEKEIKQ